MRLGILHPLFEGVVSIATHIDSHEERNLSMTQEQFEATDELTVKIKIRAGDWKLKQSLLSIKLEDIAASIRNAEQYVSGGADNDENGMASFSLVPVFTPEMKEQKLYVDACRLVAETQNASVSLIQRRLRVGYSMAARFIDAMERDGFIGPYQGTKPRQVFLRSKRS
jgi:DNA segregation ATPase FtsK/SpoIIIE-like protein